MTTEQVERKVRETLHAVDLDRVRAPGDLVEKVVRRRARRRFSQVAGTAAAVAAITAGAVLGFGGGGTTDQDRPVRPAAPPESWKPWRISDPAAAGRGCLVDGSALYCAGSKYDAAKFDANTGERLWTVKVNGGGGGSDHPFAVRDGVLYGYRNHTADKQPNGDYAGGTDLMAVNTDTGKVLWTVELAHDNRDDQSALLIDGAVLANTPRDRTMSAVDPRTGEVKWRHTWGKGIWCDRAVLSGVPYLLCRPDTQKPGDTDVFRLDPVTGRAEKVTRIPGAQQLMGISGGRMVLAEVQDQVQDEVRAEVRADLQAEVQDADGTTLPLTTVSGSGERTSYSYRIEGKPVTMDVIGERLISVSQEGKASAYSLTTGKTLWTGPVGVEMGDGEPVPGIAAPVVSERQGIVYFFSSTGDLSGLDLRTGEQVWRSHADAERPKPGTGDWDTQRAQILLYEDVLVLGYGREIVSLLPRIAD